VPGTVVTVDATVVPVPVTPVVSVEVADGVVDTEKKIERYLMRCN
jgi:hypothetical protein